jgi:hypothetical protein
MVNIRSAREAGFTTGFFFIIAAVALRTLHVHLGTFAVGGLVAGWLCLFGMLYQFSKRQHP